jgi:hypothetical protein
VSRNSSELPLIKNITFISQICIKKNNFKILLVSCKNEPASKAQISFTVGAGYFNDLDVGIPGMANLVHHIMRNLIKVSVSSMNLAR